MRLLWMERVRAPNKLQLPDELSGHLLPVMGLRGSLGRHNFVSSLFLERQLLANLYTSALRGGAPLSTSWSAKVPVA